ncbi:VWA domain-containing protein [uncultured Vibrio sp.]|mgnify:CR=1 FL=1|uniref:vWA domain-containing protein n=1 Tax=uncultured Vibrio sp. TaxID=114054 RepID=UPI0025DEDCEA|nr:VWA domain-containing protein [uncultured Vibrio sp.]
MNVDLINQFHFLRPQLLWLVIPFALVIYFNWKHVQKRQQNIKGIPEHLRRVLVIGETRWMQNLPIKVISLASILAIIILAGPSWTKQPSPFGEDKADLIILLDASSSMLQSDVAPSRLALAKFKLQDLIDSREGGRAALITYSGSAHIAMPLTKDTQVFEALFDAIEPTLMPRDGKFAQYALPLVDKLTKKDKRTTTVLLVTDALTQQSQKKITNYFNNRPHQLVIWGMGDSDKPSAIPFESDLLAQVASDSGGKFFAVTHDNRDVDKVLAKIESHLQVSEDNVMPWKDSGYPVTFMLAAIYLMWFRKGWMVKWCLLATVSLSGLMPHTAMASDWVFIDLWLTKDQQGKILYEDKNYRQAAEMFESTKWKAISYYQAGHYSLAQQYFLRTDDLFGRFGAATALMHQREYVAARKAFTAIVEQDPAYPGAQENLDLVKAIIAQIDMQSESQSNNAERQSSRELGDEPKTSEGPETKVQEEQLIQTTLTSEQILNDEDSSQLWMRRVESDISGFLASKFDFQLQEGVATLEVQDDE